MLFPSDIESRFLSVLPLFDLPRFHPPSSVSPRRTPLLSTPPSRFVRACSSLGAGSSLRPTQFHFSGAPSQPGRLRRGCHGDREGRREWSSPRKRNTTSPAAIAGSPFNGSFVVAWVGVWQPCATSHPLSTPTACVHVGWGWKREWQKQGNPLFRTITRGTEKEMDMLKSKRERETEREGDKWDRERKKMGVCEMERKE